MHLLILLLLLLGPSHLWSELILLLLEIKNLSTNDSLVKDTLGEDKGAIKVRQGGQGTDKGDKGASRPKFYMNSPVATNV